MNIKYSREGKPTFKQSQYLCEGNFMAPSFTSPDQASTWLHPDQIERLRTVCYQDCFQPPFRQRNDALITLLYDTGLRVGELVQLTVGHLDLDGPTVRLPATEQSETGQPQPRSPATLNLDPAHSLGTVRLLTSYLSNREGDSAILFPSRNGGHLTPKAVRDVVSKAATTAEIRPYTSTGRGEPADITTQTLRHSTAWRLLNVENQSMTAVRERLGHTAVSTTKSLYAGFDVDEERPNSSTSSSHDRSTPDAAITEDILDTIPDLLYAFDTDGQLLWWNGRVTDITGYTDDEIEAMHPLEFVAQEDRTEIAGAIAQILDRKSIEAKETHLRTKDGAYLPYEFTGAPIIDDKGTVQGIAGVGRNIAAHKRFERISDGFFALDTDWRVTYLNSQAEALVDRSAEDLLGNVIWDAFSEAVGLQVYDEFHTAMMTQEPASFDQYYPPLDTWFSVRAYPSETGLSVYFQDITGRKERERKLEQYRTLTEAATDVIITIDEDSIIQSVNPAVTGVFGYAPDELLGEPLTVLMPDKLASQHRDALQRYLDTGKRTLDWTNVELPGVREDGSEVPLAISFSEAEYDDQRFFTGIVRDITDQKERERALKQQRTELAQLNQFNELVQNLVHAMVKEPTRTEIEQIVCDQLAASDFYQAAWIGDRTKTTATVTPRVSAGIDLDAVPTESTASTDEESPPELALRAVDTRDVCVARQPIDDLSGDADRDQSWGVDIESALAVPIEYGDVLYGVLVVDATQATAFGDRQQTSFLDLGETIGFAIAAAERKEALVAETILELTLSIRDPDQFFIQAATQYDATVTLDGIAGRGDDVYLAYFTVTGASSAAIRDLAEQSEMPDHVRVVSTHETSILCEVSVTDSSLITTVADYGGTVTDMTAEDDHGTVRIELPRTADVSRVLDALRATVADVELQAKRTVDRSIQTDHRFQAAVTNRLTDKQRHALESAYLAGFFEQPRDSTGEEIADSMDISPSTFHQHLRVGLRKLVSPIAEPPRESA